MSKLTIFLIAISMGSVIVAAVAIYINHRRTKRTLLHMDEMLTAAIDGSFCETVFDESLLSAVETKLANYLSASAVSSKNLAEEKDKIKELIADISHQTKTPIANILLYAQLLGEQSLPEESITCVTALNTQAEKLSFLIESLVKTSRLEANVFELHPKQSLVQLILDAVLEQIAPKALKKQITINCIPTTITACFDSKWTTEAVYNIIDNAVKYTPEGGSIKVEAIAYNLFCRIDITDTGIGIAEKELPKIFGRFYRSSAVSDLEGVGIGLYLSRQIISGEGGYIKVKSEVGRGTNFSVFLPTPQ
ncbi:MAG: HAMP domain-containing sensor histidine kinase [Lachnospiraceae bacterium]|nr:HAMP domain-containing sensor histidine kinase [Lachnospiraceae bacterium]